MQYLCLLCSLYFDLNECVQLKILHLVSIVRTPSFVFLQHARNTQKLPHDKWRYSTAMPSHDKWINCEVNGVSKIFIDSNGKTLGTQVPGTWTKTFRVLIQNPNIPYLRHCRKHMSLNLRLAMHNASIVITIAGIHGFAYATNINKHTNIDHMCPIRPERANAKTA